MEKLDQVRFCNQALSKDCTLLAPRPHGLLRVWSVITWGMEEAYMQGINR